MTRMQKPIILIFLSCVSALPGNISPQAECGAPEFGNSIVTISNSAVQYGVIDNQIQAVKPRSEPNWQFELSDGHFFIHPSNDLSMSIQLSDSGVILVKTEAAEVSQQFLVQCARDCEPDGFFIGDGCTIRQLGNETKCLQLGDGPGAASEGDLVTSQPCSNIDAQRYNFVNMGAGSPPPPLVSLPPPSPYPESCGTPDFQNLKVNIANSAVVYTSTVASADVKASRPRAGGNQEFVFEKSNTFFLIHPADDPSLSIQSSPSGIILAKSVLGEVKQQFRVTCARDCNTAPDGFFIGDGCTISAVADTTLCLQIGDGPAAGGDGDAITLKTCDGTDSQRYNFVNQGPATTGSPDLCGSPDFQDLQVTIANSAVKVTAVGNQLQAFIPTDAPEVKGNQNWWFSRSQDVFVVRSVSDLSLAIQAHGRQLQLTQWSPTEVMQQFHVTCRFDCNNGPNGFFLGDGCTITSVADPTQCVQIGNGPGAGSSGDSIILEKCDRTDSQRVNFENKGPIGSDGTSGSTLSGFTESNGNTLISGAISDDDDHSGNSWAKWGPIIVALLVLNIVLTILVAARGFMRPKGAGARTVSPSYVPVRTREDHVPLGYPSGRYKDEDKSSYADPQQ